MSTFAELQTALQTAQNEIQTAANEIKVARDEAIDAVKAEAEARITRIRNPGTTVPPAVRQAAVDAMNGLAAVEAKYGLG